MPPNEKFSPLKVLAPVATQTESKIALGTLMVCSVALLAVFGTSMMAGIISLNKGTPPPSLCVDYDYSSQLTTSTPPLPLVKGYTYDSISDPGFNPAVSPNPLNEARADYCAINGVRTNACRGVGCALAEKYCARGRIAGRYYLYNGTAGYSRLQEVCPAGCSNGACTNTNGSLAIDANGDKPASTILMFGPTLPPSVNAFTMLAVNGSFTITNLVVSSAYSGSNFDRSIGAVILEYNNEAGVKQTATGYLNGGKAYFNNLSIWVPNGAGATVTIKTVITDAAVAKSGDLVRLDLAPSDGTAATFTAINKATGYGIYAYTGVNGAIGNTMVVRKAKPVVALVNLPSTTLADGRQTISKFSVVSNGGDISWRRLNLKYVVSAGITLSDCSLYKDGDSTSLASGQMNGTDVLFDLSTEQLLVRGTAPRVYAVKCDIVGSGSGKSLSTKLDGGVAPVAATNSYANLINAGETRFIWSDMSSGGAHSATSLDWCDSNYILHLPTDFQTLSQF